MPVSSQILRPISGLVIFACFLVSLLINLLPWQAAVDSFAPDFVALMIIYWCLNQPRRVGVGAAFLLGVLMDVGDANVLGQHALAYSAIACLVLLRQRRIAIYPFWQQALFAFALLLMAQLIMVAIRAVMGEAFVGWTYFLGSALAAVLWTPFSNLMLMHQRQPVSDEL
jgi:rod shape-determining protein MreD